jgi:hypothetical protein
LLLGFIRPFFKENGNGQEEESCQEGGEEGWQEEGQEEATLRIFGSNDRASRNAVSARLFV